MQKKLTIREVAEMYQVSDATVNRWIKQGKLRAAKVGKSWRIDQKDADAFYEAHVQTFEQ